MTSNRFKIENARLRVLHEYQILDTVQEDAYDDIVRLSSIICVTEYAAISFIDRNREWFKSKIGVDYQELPRGIALSTQKPFQKNPLIIEDLCKDNQFSTNLLVTGEPHIRFYAGIPLATKDDYRLGTLCVMDRKPRNLNDLQIKTLSFLGRQVMALLELRRRMAQLEVYAIEAKRYERQLEETNAKLGLLSITDELTGLGNRRAFEEYLAYEVPKAFQYKQRLSIMLIDIDHFKNYNDTFGHPSGDELLKTIAQLANKKIRNSDLVARYGGDELAVVLPNTGKEAAKVLAARFRKTVESISTLQRPVTVSIGVFSLDSECEDATTLVAEADRALYLAKNSGRNQVCHPDDL